MPDWMDALIGLASGAIGVIGALTAVRLNARKDVREERADDREKKAADDAAADRLIALIKEEAEKLVAVAKLDFDKQIAEMKLAHSKELTAMRQDFDRQIADVKRDAEAYACDVLECPNRRVRPQRQRKAPEVKVGGTD